MNRIIKQGPQQISGGAVYDKQALFKLENYDLLKMLFIEFEITPSALCTFPIPASPYLIENVILESNGAPIARVNTNYSLSRIDRANNTLKSQFDKAINLVGPFSTVQTCRLPLFFWVIDGQQLDLNLYKDLYIRVFTKSGYQQMGMSVDISSINMTLSQTTMQTNTFGYDSKLKIPMELDFSKSYNFYQAQSYTLANGSTSYRVNLNVPFYAITLMFMIRGNTNAAIKGDITNIAIKRNNGIRNEYSSSDNFYLNKVYGENEGSVFNIHYNEIEKDMAIKSNQNNGPVVAELTFAALGQESTLFIGYEYLSDIKQNKTAGGIHLIEEIPHKF